MIARLHTLIRLGLLNLLRVFFYRLQLKSGWLARRLPAGDPVTGPFFVDNPLVAGHNLPGTLRLFDWYEVETSGPPDWFRNYLNDLSMGDQSRHWSKIPDFSTTIGDIKTVWDISRFEWLVRYTYTYAQTADHVCMQRVESWLADWARKNPPNVGPNWKCAQEASIRVLHLAYASLLLRKLDKPSDAIKKLVEVHCRRILPTMHYALAQDNNHGTSEAAALFVAGAWYRVAGRENKESKRWLAVGRRWLENRAARLVMRDGSFSQHSVVYHRMMLDTLVFSEALRRIAKLPPFTERFMSRVVYATHWLHAFVDPDSGDTPNLGANDGTRLFPLPSTAYRDFRPSVQAAYAFFKSARAYPPGLYDTFALSLGATLGMPLATPGNKLFPDGGYAWLRETGGFRILLRLPQFRFRPSQADIHHIDVWYGSDNVVCDAGTYSYNAGSDVLDYYSGVRSHSTAQFDDREPMRRLGRFLFLDWPQQGRETRFDPAGAVESFHTDWSGTRHVRCVRVADGEVIVTDELGGRFRHAVLRWRLQPGNWKISGSSIRCDKYELEFASTETFKLELTEGTRSLQYFDKSQIPVIELAVRSPAIIRTTIRKLSR